MKKQSREDSDLNIRLNEANLFKLGYEYVDVICNETDELLRRYDDVKVPEDLERWFDNYKKLLIKEEKKKRFSRMNKRIMKRVAIFFVVFGISIGAIAGNVEGFRLRIFNIIKDSNHLFSEMNNVEGYEVDYSDELKDEWGDVYVLTLMPNNYHFVNCVYFNRYISVEFQNSRKQRIKFTQSLEGYVNRLDSQDSNALEVLINGEKGYIIEKDRTNILSWYFNERNFIIQGEVEKDFLIKIGESMVLNNKK